jgi:nicotinamidase-related amidase
VVGAIAGLAGSPEPAYPEVMTTSASPTLDPTCALIVIDMQVGIVAGAKAHPVDGIVANVASLATAFRTKGLPVVLVNVTGGAPGRAEQARPPGPRPEGFAVLIPELGARPTDILITKERWGAFSQPSLDAALRDAGVTQVVVCGIATSMGVESTARQAHELGYNVTLAIDAMTDASAESHANSVERVFPTIGERVSTRQVLDLLGVAGGA